MRQVLAVDIYIYHNLLLLIVDCHPQLTHHERLREPGECA
jgi:hypothetical protein